MDHGDVTLSIVILDALRDYFASISLLNGDTPVHTHTHTHTHTHMQVHTHRMPNLWMSEDNLKNSLCLPGTEFTKLSAKCFYQLSHIANLIIDFCTR
jgi:hypothetical protein